MGDINMYTVNHQNIGLFTIIMADNALFFRRSQWNSSGAWGLGTKMGSQLGWWLRSPNKKPLEFHGISEAKNVPHRIHV